MKYNEYLTRHDRFCCKLTDTPWQGRWWLMDVETNGLDCRENDIIALYLSCMEGFKTIEERTLLIRPRHPSSPWAEGLTGIANRELEQAAPLGEALAQLDAANASGCLLLYHQSFVVSFLKNAYERCGREFQLDYLPLDRLAVRLGAPWPKPIGRVLEALEAPTARPYAPPGNRYLAQLYQLALTLFEKLDTAYDVHDTAQLARFFALEHENGYFAL
jgi:hypothetical protein